MENEAYTAAEDLRKKLLKRKFLSLRTCQLSLTMHTLG